MKRKYKLYSDTKRKETSERLKQRLSALSHRLKRFQTRQKQFHKNYTFENDPQRCYKELRGAQFEVDDPPKKEDIENFWKPIYETSKSHNTTPQWIKDHENHVKASQIEEQGQPKWDQKNITETLKTLQDWKGPGPDQIQAFWWKNFTFSHDQLTEYYAKFLENPESCPDWFTKGRTTLIPKSREYRNSKNYRPITCLPIVYKIFSKLIGKELMQHIKKYEIIPEEQKGAAENTLGCLDQLLIDSMITEDEKQLKKNLSTAWIDYAKAYDSIPHSWILHCLKTYNFSHHLINYIGTSMKQWKTVLFLHHKNGTVQSDDIKINSGILQGDCPAGILFVWLLPHSHG